jgi:hypothetical protein
MLQPGSTARLAAFPLLGLDRVPVFSKNCWFIVDLGDSGVDPRVCYSHLGIDGEALSFRFYHRSTLRTRKAPGFIVAILNREGWLQLSHLFYCA